MDNLTLAHEPTLYSELLRKMDAYWRAANYLSVGQNMPEIRGWQWSTPA